MRFQEPRDGAILQAHYKYGLLHIEDNHQMFWVEETTAGPKKKSLRAVQKRLTKLCGAGYLNRPTADQVHTWPASKGLYWLGWRGAHFIADQKGIDIDPPASASKAQLREYKTRLQAHGIYWWEPNFNQIAHDRAVVKFRLLVEQAADQRPFLTLDGEWVTETQFRSWRKTGVIPDGYFVIVDELRRAQGIAARAPHLVEIDLGTHPKTRFGRNKATRGLAFLHSQEYESRFGCGGCWLIVTSGDKRMRYLMSETLEAVGKKGAGAFFFSTFDDIEGANLLTDRIWWQPGRGQTALFAIGGRS